MPTHDPAIRDHKAWLGCVQQKGLVVSPAALVDAQVVLDRNTLPMQERFLPFVKEATPDGVDQKRRVLAELGRYDQTQMLLNLDLEKRQLASNRCYWGKWLANVEGDLQREPDRVGQFYQVTLFRIEPVGLAYLWPVTG